jgi:hypothetical protein
VTDHADREERLDAMCRRLAEVGVPLFEPTASGPGLGTEEYEELIVGLFRSGEPRLRLAIPCLLAVQDGKRARDAVARASATMSAREADELGLLYRLARCLVVSRAPYLALNFGRRPSLPPLPIEPIDIPGPEELRGEKGLRFASEVCLERGLPDMPGGAERQFDTWLDIAWVERRRRVSA